MKIFIIILVFLAHFVVSQNITCIENCKKQHGNHTLVKFCSNFFTNFNVPFDGAVSVCYFLCGVNSLYPGTCECPNDCMEHVKQGKCVPGRGCLCSEGFFGKDCFQKKEEIRSSKFLPSLPYGEPFGKSPYHERDLYKDNHPLFNTSVLSELKIDMNPRDFSKMVDPNTIFDIDYLPCTLTIINERINQKILNVGVKPKGLGGRLLRKKALKFTFSKFGNFNRTLFGIRRFGLKGQQESMTGTKSFLVSELYRAIGAPSQRGSFARLFINDIYQGLYWMHEDFENEYFRSRYENLGSFYKNGVGIAGLQYLGEKQKPYKSLNITLTFGNMFFQFFGYEKKTGDIKDYKNLVNFISFLNTTSDQEFKEKIETKLNIDGFLKQLVVETCIMNFDTYLNWNNYILYEDNQRFEFISHDFDLAFFKEDLTNYNVYRWHYLLENLNRFPYLTDRIIKIPEYRKKFTQYFYLFLEKVFHPNRIIFQRLDSIYELLKYDLERDRSYGLDCISLPGTFCPRNIILWRSELNRIKEIIKMRYIHALEQLDK